MIMGIGHVFNDVTSRNDGKWDRYFNAAVM